MSDARWAVHAEGTPVLPNTLAEVQRDMARLGVVTAQIKEIVASFVGNNVVAIGDLPAVIAALFGTLRSVTKNVAEKPAETPVPAVPIKKSIGTDYLICLEDGRKVKPLNRYLASSLQPDAGPVSATLGAGQDLPHGRAGLQGAALGLGQADRPRPQASRRGTLPCPEPAPAAPQPPRRVGGRRKSG